MVVALSTVDGQAQQRSPDDLQRVRDELGPSNRLIVAASRLSVRSHPHEAGRGDLFLSVCR